MFQWFFNQTRKYYYLYISLNVRSLEIKTACSPFTWISDYLRFSKQLFDNLIYNFRIIYTSNVEAKRVLINYKINTMIFRFGFTVSSPGINNPAEFKKKYFVDFYRFFQIFPDFFTNISDDRYIDDSPRNPSINQSINLSIN